MLLSTASPPGAAQIPQGDIVQTYPHTSTAELIEINRQMYRWYEEDPSNEAAKAGVISTSEELSRRGA